MQRPEEPIRRRPVPQFGSEMRHLWYDYIKTNVDLSFAAGLMGIFPPWFDSKPKWYRVLWSAYRIATDLILYVTTAANLIGAILLTNIFDVFASLPPLIHGLQMTGRLVVFQARKSAINGYLKDLNEVLAEDEVNPIETNGNFRLTHSSDFNLNRRLTAFEFFSLLMSNVVFFIPECVKSFLHPDTAHVIIVSWYPYDANIAGYKQMTNAFHTVSWLLINFKMASFDTLLQSLIILHTSQFRQLRRLFGMVLPEDESNIARMGPRESAELERKLHWWIRQHQRTLTVTKKLQDLCSPLLFFSYVECLFNMCLCAFLTTVESQWTPLQRFSAVFVVGTVFVQMFIMCRLGDYIEQSSVLVPELGYNPTIFRCGTNIQKSMVMILKRMHSSVRFSAMNLFHLNSKDYGSLVQGVFSYYMALRQLQFRN